MPERFPMLSAESGTDIRRATRGSYYIFYSVRAAEIEVLRILHAARDDERLLFPEG
jgi:plasmid stabilization system protein ParE